MKRLIIAATFIVVVLLLAMQAEAATYYVDLTSGNDANNCTAKATPCLHAPHMTNCANTCAGITMVGDDQIIFKGGTSITGSAAPWAIRDSGTSGHNIYIGVDLTWYTGGSFSRPKLDGNYTYGAIINLDSPDVNYVTFDNLEVSHIEAFNSDDGSVVRGFGSHDLLFKNMYIHGWRCAACAGIDGQHGGFKIAFSSIGDRAARQPTIEIQDSIIENSENSGTSTQQGIGVTNVGIFLRSTIHDVSSAMLFPLIVDCGGVGGLYNVDYPSTNASIDPAYHLNGIYLDAAGSGQTTGYIRNCYFRDIGDAANAAFPNPREATIYVYNNIFYGYISMQGAVEVDPYDYGGTNGGSVVVANNVFYMPGFGITTAIHVVDRSGDTPPVKVTNFTSVNNQFIGDGVFQDDASAANVSGTITRTTNVTQATATATSQGYLSANLWAPQNGSGGTCNAGTSQSSIFTVTYDGFTRPSTWDIGAWQCPGTTGRGPGRLRIR